MGFTVTEYRSLGCALDAPVAIVSLGRAKPGVCQAADAAGSPFYYVIEPASSGAAGSRLNVRLRCTDNTCASCVSVARNISADGTCLPGTLADFSFRLVPSSTVKMV